MNRAAIFALLTVGTLLLVPTTATARYVDGMSLYRGYFVPAEVDPEGSLKLTSVNGGPFTSGRCSGGYMGVWIELDDDEKKLITKNGGVLVAEKKVKVKWEDCFGFGCGNAVKEHEEGEETYTCYPIRKDGTFTETWKNDTDGTNRQYDVVFNQEGGGGFGTFGQSSGHFHVDLFSVNDGQTPEGICEKYFERRKKPDGRQSKGYHADEFPALKDVTFTNHHETVDVEYDYDFCEDCDENIRSRPDLPAGPNREGK